MKYKIYNGTKHVATFSIDIIHELLNMIIFGPGLVYDYIYISCYHNKKYGIKLSLDSLYDNCEVLKIKFYKNNLKNFVCHEYFKFVMRLENFNEMSSDFSDNDKIKISVFDKKIVYRFDDDTNYIFDKTKFSRQFLINTNNMNKYHISTKIFTKFATKNNCAIAFNTSDILLETQISNNWEDEKDT